MAQRVSLAQALVRRAERQKLVRARQQAKKELMAGMLLAGGGTMLVVVSCVM